MVHWEFRLQKKGDSAWLLLETTEVEVLAGEYRLAVRCQYAETAVQIQVRYLPTPEVSQATGEYGWDRKFTKTTSAAGLLMVLPFTVFTPGTWLVRCTVPDKGFTVGLRFAVIPAPVITEQNLVLFRLQKTDFVVSDRFTITLPIATVGAGELTIVLKNPQTLQPVWNLHPYLLQGGSLDLEIELPQNPSQSVLLGEASFAGITEHFSVTYPPHLLPPALTLTDLPPLRSASPAPRTPPFAPPPPASTEEERFLQKLAQIHPLADEAVMDQELEQLLQTLPSQNKNFHRLPQVYQPPQGEAPVVPILDIPEGELIAGIPIPVLAYVPVSATPQSVKLWIKDCQTRSILDGPRWLVDFQRQGEILATKTQVTIPLGCLEIAFEAITVDMQNQRESYKTRALRRVTPPHLA